MVSVIPLLILLSSLELSLSLQWIAVNNATIKIMPIKDNVDVIFYEKNSRNTSEIIVLPFMLLNSTAVSVEAINLKINNASITVETFEDGNTPSSISKIFIIKEIFVDSISYKIQFSKVDNVKAGEYRLCLTIKSQEFCASSFVFSPPIVAKFPKTKLGLEGEPVRITCLYDSYPEVTEITWKLIRGSSLELANITELYANDHIKFISGKESKHANDTLFIEKLLKSDVGIYMCSISSKLGRDMALVKINVKDRWAALYPFIGIIIEVIILVIAILGYEKYQVRSQKQKPDNDIDEETKEPEVSLKVQGVCNEDIVEGGDLPGVEIDDANKKSSFEVRQREMDAVKM